MRASVKFADPADAGSNPVGFFLIGGQAHDQVGAVRVQAKGQANMLIADKAFDADECVLDPQAAAGKTAVVPVRDVSGR